MESCCPLCKIGDEDVEHLVQHCSILNQSWSLLKLPIPPNTKGLYYKEWLADTFLKPDEKSKKRLVICYWAIWYARNKLIHDGIKWSINELVGLFRGLYWKGNPLKTLDPYYR